MNDLQIGDKVYPFIPYPFIPYPLIPYQGGGVWVDVNAEIKDGDLYINGNHFYKADRYYDKAQNDKKPIAQTPDFTLEGVPVVMVEDDVEKLIFSYFIDSVENKKGGHIAFDKHNIKLLVQQVKAAQSKGGYSEEQVRQAWIAGSSKRASSIAEDKYDYPDKELTEDQFIASIKPKIVVMTKEFCADDSCPVDGACEHCRTPIPQPISFTGEDGRTYFKIKP